MEYEVIMGIVNEHHHWTLVVIYPREKKSLFLDPLGESKTDIKKCLEITRGFMRAKGISVSRWSCDTVPHPKEVDGTSCGVFALTFAEKILKGESIEFDTNTQAVNSLRFTIALTLLQQTDDLTDVCHHCGEEEHETNVDWIQCDDCLRWFHQECVGNPPVDEAFHCPTCVSK
ncbi:sentrin-specific protease 2-like [Melanotaenia boesemani]|uniref:sentrin-specific protease 2-like n=1 Tax=Melanotaenia boesemani TaxID=1250792 RepID=UPI001C03CDCE|nr:sentrin-specific protease 2-like [Melanotaenia boesemani]